MNIEDFEVGMKVRYGDSLDVEEVLAVGNQTVYLRTIESGAEWTCQRPALLTVVREYPEAWTNIYRAGEYSIPGETYASEADANADSWFDNAIARIHLATDGTLTLENLK
jgi:hypothetical protein